MYLVCPKVAIVVWFVELLLRAAMEDGEADRLAADVSVNRRSVHVRGSRPIGPPPITDLSAVPSSGVGGATGTLHRCPAVRRPLLRRCPPPPPTASLSQLPPRLLRAYYSGV